ncbi:DUF1156 domain-containing protein [Streptomonospora sp. PA3]|nr:DUF1156 domain-containing protein [Streptomonospora sp. PA3]
MSDAADSANTADTAEGGGYRKKLIEVSLPLEAINRESAREKSIRHGHPSTLHLWWARRPLAAARAVLFAQLVDDPSSRPEEFPTTEEQDAERKRLFGIIEELVKWDNIHDTRLYKEAYAEILKSTDGNPPPILDPFAGGGTIPLEAQRLGLEAHASDLNPVAVLINKALIEIPPKWAGQPPVFPGAADQRADWPGATGLAEDVRRYGKWMRDEAEKRIGHLYPKAKLENGEEANVIAWIWARTVTCPNPACQGEMPLVRSFWLGKKKGKERYIEPVVEDGKVRFEIMGPEGSPREGTVGRKGATCLICDTPVPLSYIRNEGKAKKIRKKLMAIAAENNRLRSYIAPTPEHEMAAETPFPPNTPNGELAYYPRDNKALTYGMKDFTDLFTNRQLTSLVTFSELIDDARDHAFKRANASLPNGGPLAEGGNGARAYSESIATYLTLGISRLTDISNALCRWENTKTQVRNLFGRQAIPMVWDFAETQPFGNAAGGFLISLGNLVKSIEAVPTSKHGVAVQGDASTRSYQNLLVSTDPPYYDNIIYSNLADFFYIWLRHSLNAVFPNLLSTLLTPKTSELVANNYRHGGRESATKFFEDGFQETFNQINAGSPEKFPTTIFYAFKQSEKDENGEASTGWETLLEGMIRSGWAITATWPLRTELGNRMMSHDMNALASSIVLACRPRRDNTGSINKRDFIAELRDELPLALRDLQQGSIPPVDMAQAAIGPGMAVFSRYSRVEEPDGSAMRVREALRLINQILAEVLSEQEGDFDATTRWCIDWFKSYGFDQHDYGTAETLSRAKNVSVEGLKRAGVIQSGGGKVTLLPPAKLLADYDPTADTRISEWETVMHLAKRLEEQGVNAAARLVAAAQAKGVDLDSAKELAYLLYSIAEQRGWAQHALLFNSLGTSWNELEGLSQAAEIRTPAPVQGALDDLVEDSEDV